MASAETVPVGYCGNSYPEVELNICVRSGPLVPFSALELPITRTQLQQGIQALATSGYGVAYQHLGSQEDWDHGHIFVSTADGKPMALVFHTQEQTIPVPIYFKSPQAAEQIRRSLYSNLLKGLDRTQRSWIYFLSNGQLKLARLFSLDARPESFDADFWQKMLAANTYGQYNIDPAKLGFPFRETTGFEFHKIDCRQMPAHEETELNILRISIPRGEVCLHVSTVEKATPK